jgi:CDP-diacylglycerol--glycerol-3-phosphate 3-phosphatidyltransferase
MNDAEFARAFETGQIANTDFHHVDHLRLAWAYLEESPSVEAAMDRMRAALQRFAASVGKPEKYSDPMTWFWMREVAAARATLEPGVDFDGMLRANPQLRDKERYQGLSD